MDLRRFNLRAAPPAEWAAFHAFRRRRCAEDDPGDPVPEDAEVEHDARTRWPHWGYRRVLAWDAGQVVGSATMSFRRLHTPDYADYAPFTRIWGGVLQPWRRRGVATALLRPVLATMRAHGKTVATFWTSQPDGHAFLAATGAELRNRSVENRLPLAGLDWPALARWEAALPAGAGLRWEVHAGRVPLERLAALVPSFTVLTQDEPMGTLNVPPSRYSLEGYSAWYEEADRTGSDHFLVLLLDGKEVAGMCEGGWNARVPGRAWQALTAVARSWRGQGLAKALKARMLRLIAERHPGVALMTTDNAESNAPMLSINARLGFVRHRESGTYQIGPDALEAWLLSRTPRHGA